MQAYVAVEHDVLVVRLSGRLDFETAEPFREACFSRFLGHKVVFDFRYLGFVVSSGILSFAEIFKEFEEKNPAGFKISGMSPEFRRIFQAMSLKAVEFYEDSDQAVRAFLIPKPAAVPQVGEPVPVVSTGEN